MKAINKNCIKCGERKSLKENFNQYEPGKYRNICNLCQRKTTKDWESLNKKRFEEGLIEIPLIKTRYVCKETKNRDNFTTDRSRKDGLYSACMACCTIKSKKIYKENKARENNRAYAYKLFKFLGLTLEQKEQMFNDQGRKCAVCGSDNVNRRFNGRDANWPVDHDHITGKIRGILCNPCNVVLGNCKDSIPRLEALIEYLKKHTSPTDTIGLGGADGLPPLIATP